MSICGDAYDMSVHPSARDTKPTFYLPHEAKSVVSCRRHPLIYVPSFKTEMKFFWKMLQPGRVSFSHHSVYLKRETEPNSNENDFTSLDKFAPFRSDGTDVEFDVELLGSDICDNWVALRIDILPWFTHLNSTMPYSSQTDEIKSEPFPQVRSAAIKASTSKLRVATWFGDDLDSLCLIVKRVNYNATVDGSKDIVIEGPVQAALLDVSEFTREKVAGDHQESSDMMDMEHIASEFGAARSWNNSEVNEHSSRAESFSREEIESTPFLKLQQLSCNIDELDYVVVTGQIDIRNQSLARILAGGTEDCAKTSSRKLERTESHFFAGVDRTTWSILVSRLRLLWTIEIRDSLMAISKDLIHSIGFMKSQIRQLQVLSGKTSQQDNSVRGSHDISSTSLAGEEVELSMPDTQQNESVLHESMLEYLLEESFDLDFGTDGGDIFSAATAQNDEKEKKEGKTLPTLDIHFSNPQVVRTNDVDS